MARTEDSLHCLLEVCQCACTGIPKEERQLLLQRLQRAIFQWQSLFGLMRNTATDGEQMAALIDTAILISHNGGLPSLCALHKTERYRVLLGLYVLYRMLNFDIKIYDIVARGFFSGYVRDNGVATNITPPDFLLVSINETPGKIIGPLSALRGRGVIYALKCKSVAPNNHEERCTLYTYQCNIRCMPMFDMCSPCCIVQGWYNESGGLFVGPPNGILGIESMSLADSCKS